MEKRIISELEVAGQENTYLKTDLYYSKGGMNYFTGRVEARGLYVSVSPIRVTKRGTHSIEEYTAFTGTKMLVAEMKRFNKKIFDTFQVSNEVLQKLTDLVLVKNKITLKQPEPIQA